MGHCTMLVGHVPFTAWLCPALYKAFFDFVTPKKDLEQGRSTLRVWWMALSLGLVECIRQVGAALWEIMVNVWRFKIMWDNLWGWRLSTRALRAEFFDFFPIFPIGPVHILRFFQVHSSHQIRKNCNTDGSQNFVTFMW